jgi:DNA-binding NarL/FixJ family response regulator
MVMKKIPGYEGYYATEDGQIISIRTGRQRILSQRIHKGYLHVQIRKGIGRHTQVKVPVHQLVLSAFKGEKKLPELVGRHLDGNKLNNYSYNLEWGTVLDNYIDAVQHGTAACFRYGENHPYSKLKEKQVIKIIELINSGMCNKDISLIVNITKNNVNAIRTSKTWKYIPRGVL